MWIRHLAIILCAGAFLAAGSTEGPGEAKTAAGTGPPELALAVAVDGRTLEIQRFVERVVTRTTTPRFPPGVQVEVRQGSIEPTSRTELFPIIEKHSTRIEVVNVSARRVDGSPVERDVLLRKLNTWTPVLIIKHNQQVDPIFWDIFQAETLLLMLPPPSAPLTVSPVHTAPTLQSR